MSPAAGTYIAWLVGGLLSAYTAESSISASANDAAGAQLWRYAWPAARGVAGQAAEVRMRYEEHGAAHSNRTTCCMYGVLVQNM
jgi:hypothetical protein